MKDLLEINDYDREEIAKQIKNGNMSGIMDSDGNRISWSIDIEKFKN